MPEGPSEVEEDAAVAEDAAAAEEGAVDEVVVVAVLTAAEGDGNETAAILFLLLVNTAWYEVGIRWIDWVNYVTFFTSAEREFDIDCFIIRRFFYYFSSLNFIYLIYYCIYSYLYQTKRFLNS